MFGLLEGAPGMTLEEATKTDLRNEKIEAIHRMADYFTGHPDFPVPSFTVGAFVPTKEETIRLVQGGIWEKKPSGSLFFFYKQFDSRGNVKLYIAANREQLCERVVVGTQWVGASPAVEATEAHEEEIVEWICPDSLMKGDGHGSSQGT